MRGFLIDMDGVIYRDSKLIPGADVFIRRLLDEKVPFLFLTNNSQRARRDVATKLQRMGIDANPRRDRAAVQRCALDQLIRPMLKDRVLDIDEDCALTWRRLLEDGRSRGRSFEPADLAIAATALVHDLTVATRDLRQFQAAGARTFNPWIAG